jgi:hypothetical protein
VPGRRERGTEDRADLPLMAEERDAHY